MKKGLTLILVIISSFFLIACGNERVRYVAEDFYSMNTIISITVPENIKEEQKYLDAHYETKIMFDYIHNLTDNFREYSGVDVINSIYTINNTLLNSEEDFELFEIDFELYEMLEMSLEIENLTNGYFNITIGKIIDLWKENVVSKTGVVSNEIINDTLSRVNAIDVVRNAYTLSADNNKYYVEIDTRVKLDLGAVAKGYALEKAIEIFEEHEITDYIINAGSSSIGLGEKQSATNGNYRVGLINPDKTWTFYAIASVKNNIVTTSGSYEQFAVDEDGNVYHHLISPITKKPENYYGTVTVISREHAGKMDALTTAIYLMDPSLREEFLSSNDYETLSYRNGIFEHINPKNEVENKVES